MRSFLLNRFFSKGIYEYVITRTKFIDKIFSRALLEQFDQILLFGAGFDSRSVRLVNDNVRTKIFELNVSTTISDKLKQYKKRNIDLGKTIFVKIGFNTDNFEKKMKNAGFEYIKKHYTFWKG